MAKKLITNYTFNKVAKTVTLNEYTSISLSNVLLVTNVTSNIIVYNFADPLRGGTVLTNVLTLNYDTSSMSNSDILQIFYEDADALGKTSVDDLATAIRTLILVLANPSYIDKSANQMRAQITGSLTTAGTVSTVATVTGLTNIDGYQGKSLMIADNINAWANVVRSSIT